MVVLAAATITKYGKILLSRQFSGLPRSRVESLLNSLPQLISPGSESTVVDASGVRFLYIILDDLLVVLITNTQSNPLLDLTTLTLCSRIVTELGSGGRGGAVGEDDLKRVSFEVLSAWDEVVSLGWRENVSLGQVRTTLEMESHEEKIQEIIARNKEAEAKEETRRRAKQLEMQRQQMPKRGANANPNSSSGFGNNSASSYVPTRSAPTYDARSSHFSQAEADRTAASSGSAKVFKTKGMQLGSKKAGVVDRGLREALGGLDEEAQVVVPRAQQSVEPVYADRREEVARNGNGSSHGTAAVKAAATVVRPGSANPFGDVEELDVHLQIRETISLSLSRDGGLVSLALKGDLNLLLASSDHAAALSVILSPPSSFDRPAGNGNDIQFKTHPNVDKKAWADNGEIRLKEGKKFPVGQAVGVLKWRVTGKDESVVPISINCWPSYDVAASTCTVNLEYELESPSLSLHDLVIRIPLPRACDPQVTVAEEPTCGEYASLDGEFEWRIEEISALLGNTNGSIEFEVSGIQEDTEEEGQDFFPVAIEFVAQSGVAGVDVREVVDPSTQESIEFSLDTLLTAEDYLVV